MNMYDEFDPFHATTQYLNPFVNEEGEGLVQQSMTDLADGNLAPLGSQLIDQPAPQQMGALAPGEWQMQPPPQYEERPYEGMNPRVAMWGGMLSDLGKFIGSNGREGMGQSGLKNYMALTRDRAIYDQQQQKNKRGAWRDNMAYGQHQNQVGRQGVADERYASEQEAKAAAAAEDLRRWQAEQGLAWAKLNATSGTAGQPTEKSLRLENTLRDAFQKDVGDGSAALAAAQQALSLTNLDSGTADAAMINRLYKILDPQSIVSQGETDLMEQAQGKFEMLKNLVDKHRGKGPLGEEGRKSINQTINELVKIAQQSELSQRDTWEKQHLGEQSVVRPEAVMGSAANYQAYFNEYARMYGPEAATVEKQKVDAGAQPTAPDLISKQGAPTMVPTEQPAGITADTPLGNIPYLEIPEPIQY